MYPNLRLFNDEVLRDLELRVNCLIEVHRDLLQSVIIGPQYRLIKLSLHLRFEFQEPYYSVDFNLILIAVGLVRKIRKRLTGTDKQSKVLVQ